MDRVDSNGPGGLDVRGFVVSAMRDARVHVDARGLVPLEDARRLVAETRAYRKGEGEEIDGTFVLEADRTWAALLSLEDGAEFLTHARRISWEFHVRGRDNLALLERYGAAILPWLRSRLRPDGVLVNVPWCVVPCLLAIGERDALELALEARAVHELVPGQPPLGAGPGAFRGDTDGAEDAADAPASGVTAHADAVASDAPPQAFLSPTEGLDLARRWLAQHPSGYGLLADLAESGNARAVDLLRERGKTLGGVVIEALAASLGEPRAASIADRFELPRSTASGRVQAVLAAALTVDVARGPVWSIAELDDDAREYDLPLWDNANYTTAAMRVTGFASAQGDVLAVETIEYDPRAREPVRWQLTAYGPGARTRRTSELLADADEMAPLWLPGDSDYVDTASNHLMLGGDRDEHGELVEGTERRIVPTPLPFEYQDFRLRQALSKGEGEEVRTTYTLPRSFASLSAEERALLRLVTPAEAMLVRLCAEHADRMWATDDALREVAGAPVDGRALFHFTQLSWPVAGEPASSSDDLVAITEALRTRRAITRLPEEPNTRPECWLPDSAELRCYAGMDAWGDEDPIEPGPIAAGAGATPYWSATLARGWPHGVMMMHTPEWNMKGQAEQTVPYLLDVTQQAMHVFWPRRTACIFLRAVGALEQRWAKDDPGARRVMTRDALVGLGEAGTIVRTFVSRRLAVPAYVGAELAGILEALAGGAQTIAAFADALVQLPDDGWRDDRPALAAAVFELGFLLRRRRGDRGALRERLARAHDPAHRNDVARALDLVLNGRAGAERSARAEIDYLHVVDDPAWARARIVDVSTAASPIDAALYPLAGDALLDKWAPRLADAPDPRWLATQLCVLGGTRALSLVVQLYAERADARDAVKTKLLERTGIGQALERMTGGPHGGAVRDILEALDA
jgi:hypothetical protein